MVFDDGLPALPVEVQKRILAIYVRDRVARQAATCTVARHLLSHDMHTLQKAASPKGYPVHVVCNFSWLVGCPRA